VTRRTASRVLLTLAIAGGALALLVAVTGGFYTRVAGMRLSAHGALRPLLFALLTGAIALRLLRADEREGLIERTTRVGARLAPWSAAMAAAVVLAIGLAYGTRSAGGPDTYAYVSQARLWLSGHLHVHQDFVAGVPWPYAEWTFSPLGYRPAENHTIVSTVPPGLPLLMAASMKITGGCGAFFVAPVCAALVILLAYVLGARLSGPATGIVAALIAATSPTLIFMSLWSMSDVPATALWTGAIVMAWRPPRAFAAALAGVAAGVAIAVRPNLAPLLVFPVVLLAFGNERARMWRMLTFALSCLPFIAFVAMFNRELYGSALESGYGDIAPLFSMKNVGTNVSHFSRWLWQTQGPLVFLCVAAPFVRWGQIPPRETRQWGLSPLLVRVVLLAFVAGVFACYLLYVPFHAWWFLRFVLPAFPVMFTLAADAVWSGSTRFGRKARAVLMLVFMLVGVDRGIRVSKEQGVLDLGHGEEKYSDVGRFVARELPPNAVVIAILHSGSVRYYSGRLTLRYEWLDAEWLDRSVAYLKSHGSKPYILLEASELAEFREKFKTQQTLAALDRQPIATHPRGVNLYAIDPSGAAGAPRLIPRTSGCE